VWDLTCGTAAAKACFITAQHFYRFKFYNNTVLEINTITVATLQCTSFIGAYSISSWLLIWSNRGIHLTTVTNHLRKTKSVSCSDTAVSKLCVGLSAKQRLGSVHGQC